MTMSTMDDPMTGKRVGVDIALPDLLVEVAACARRDGFSGRCGARSTDLAARAEAPAPCAPSPTPQRRSISTRRAAGGILPALRGAVL
jgi:hypothetical protein